MFTTESFYNGRIVLHGGDSREVAATIPPNSLDSLVTDTPYALESVIKRFGAANAAPVIPGKTGVYARGSAGFMGQRWDTGDTAHDPEFWRLWWRALKPGAYVAAFGGDRTVHRLAGAIEAAGFEIRHRILNFIDPADPVVKFMESLDREQLGAFLRCLDDSAFGGALAWVFGTGFPKSHNISKAIDGHLFRQWLAADPERHEVYRAEMAATKKFRNHAKRREAKEAIEQRWRAIGGFLREVIGNTAQFSGRTPGLGLSSGYHGDLGSGHNRDIDKPATGEAFQWEGWGTALKPAFEPIVIARKPLSEQTVAANVLRWRTGALNIDGCRIHTEGSEAKAYTVRRLKPGATLNRTGGNWRPENEDAIEFQGQTKASRWPANVITDGSDVVCDMFPDTESGGGARNSQKLVGIYGAFSGDEPTREFAANAGSASRFFYSSKANADDRAGSKHPTVKPVSLKQWLVRLVTPPGGVTVDPFAGTGTTGEAAVREGLRCIMVEREAKYLDDIRRRLDLIFAGPEERQRRITKPAPASGLPLFAAAAQAAPEPRGEAVPRPVPQAPPSPKPARVAPAGPPGPSAVSLLAKLRASAGRVGPIPKLTTEAMRDDT